MSKFISKTEDILASKNFSRIALDLYGESSEIQLTRYISLYDKHSCKFSKEALFFSSPGRIEVIGNHTDHNNGKVLTASISVDTLACVTPINENTVCIYSYGYPIFSVDLSNLENYEDEAGTSVSLVKGVAKYFVDNGFNIGGFNATVTSDVFKGAGVSSSASFELLIAEIFNVLYNNGSISKMQKAIASQYAENVYFKKPCGLMDQSAIALGGISMIDFNDASNPLVESFCWPFNQVDIFIVNTGGDHSDLTSNYASIRYEMESVANYFNKTTLRCVDESEFYDALSDLQNKVSGRALLRAVHYFEENKRVDKAVEFILTKNLNGLMEIINESGKSSYKLLQNCYAECDKTQRIPLALQLSKNQKGVFASRVHGGGFMGTIISFVNSSCSNDYFNNMKGIFGQENIFKLTIRKSGATVVEL